MIEFLIGAALAVGKAYDVPARTRAYAAEKKNNLVAKSKATARSVPTAARNKIGQWSSAAGTKASHWYLVAGERFLVQAERFQLWADTSAEDAVRRYMAKWTGRPFAPLQAPSSKPAGTRTAPTTGPGSSPRSAPAASPAMPTSSGGPPPARPSAPAGPTAPAAGSTGLQAGSLPYPNPAPYSRVVRPGFDLPTPRPTPPAPVPYQRNPMDNYRPATREQAISDVNSYSEFKGRLDEFRNSAYDDLEMALNDLARANSWAAHLDTTANGLKDRGFDDATIAEVRVLAEHAKAQAAAQQGVAAAAAGTFSAAWAAHQNVVARWDTVQTFVAELQNMPDINFFKS
ncbi:hypothetical protein ACIQF6_28490 [Kitasatospora sp. NPDC092948]|uniref:hypothetical protein n=1 Tax=Kitasatospora sp. NPDC092948 TaxID=3364088 RepID=UPI00382E1A5A